MLPLGVVKSNMDKTPVEPDLAEKIRREIGESLADLMHIPIDAALALFDRSFLVPLAATTPWPILHEDAEYWAHRILEREGTRLP